MRGLDWIRSLGNWTKTTTLFRLGQICLAIAVLAYYATPLRHAADEHKYTDVKFVYATVVGSISLTTALPLLIIPLFSQSRGVAVLCFWEILIFVAWIALFIVFRGFLNENPEMDDGIEKMIIAEKINIVCAALWLFTASRGTWVFWTNIFKDSKTYWLEGRPKAARTTGRYSAR